MKNKLIISLLLIIGTLFSLGFTSACSCIYLENTEQKLENAEYVFSGQVVDIKFSGQEYDELQDVSIKTIQYWKPSQFPESVNLNLYAIKDSGANCGYNFEKGKNYLIYAYLDIETGKLTTNSCMGNSIISEETQEIKELNNLTNSTPTDYDYKPVIEEKGENIVLKFFNWLKNLFS